MTTALLGNVREMTTGLGGGIGGTASCGLNRGWCNAGVPRAGVTGRQSHPATVKRRAAVSRNKLVAALAVKLRWFVITVPSTPPRPRRSGPKPWGNVS